MEPRLQLAVRNAACTDCKLHQQAEGDDVCATGVGPVSPDVLVVTKFPASVKMRLELEADLRTAGLPADVSLMFTGAVKCRTWELEPGRADLKACKHYLDEEIAFTKVKWVLALGNEGLSSTAGKSGITKYRGIPFPGPHDSTVIATISPGMFKRNPGLRGGYDADLRYFVSQVTGKTTADDSLPSHVERVDTKAQLRAMRDEMLEATGCSFDIETTGHTEFEPGAAIVSLCVTTWRAVDDPEPIVWQLPLGHPESPWRTSWQRILAYLAPAFNRIPVAVAHNGKFDCRWLRHFGVTRTTTFDTMFAAHLLDENRPKGLKPLARQLLGAEAWAMSTKSLLEEPIDRVLEYNGLDTWHTMRLWRIFRQQLIEQPRLHRIFRLLLMPASEVFTDVERRGLWVDRETLHTNWRIAEAELEDVEQRLLALVPDDWAERSGTKEINYNASNWLRWMLFDHLGAPVRARGKTKDDGSPGAPSVAEAVMLDLAEMDGEVGAFARLLIERSKWFKYCSSFFSAYDEQLDANDRIHSTFKITGTVTGRLSSGKADEEKVTTRRQIRGVNLQQVPRDKFVRGIFGAEPGWSFIEADYSQVELRIAAEVSGERNMLHHYATGQDLHMAMACRMTGKPAHLVTSEERKKAKPVNFGYLYGMGWRKFQVTAWTNYGLRFTDAEAEASRTAFFDMWPDLMAWHAKQRRLAATFGRVESPIGRVRHLPDIYSPHQDVRAEAERQAINSPVQAFASDLTVLSLVLLDEAFKREGLRARPLGTVHDAVNFEAPDEELYVVLPLIKDTMQNLPIQRKFGYRLRVPLIADLKVGQRWGGARELTEEEIYAWPR